MKQTANHCILCIWGILTMSVTLSGSQEEIRHRSEMERSALAELPKCYPLTGINTATTTYGKEEVKRMPVISFFKDEWKKPIDVDKIWEKATQNHHKYLNKKKKLMGFHILEFIGFDKIYQYCIYIKEKIIQRARKSVSLEEYAAQEKQNKQKIALAQLQIALEKEKRKGNAEKFAANRALIIQYILGGTLLVAITTLLFAFGYGWLLPFFQFFSLRVKLKIVTYTNARRLFSTTPKIESVANAYYNTKESAQLNHLHDTIMLWAKEKNAITRHLLLCGPPGSGKSLFAKIIAKESGITYYQTSGSRLNRFKKDKGSGQVQHQLLLLFKKAKKKKKAIIIIDEVDLIDPQDLKTLQGEFDSAVTDSILLIFTTNDLTKIPKATRNRFVKVHINLPNKATIESILDDLIITAEEEKALDVNIDTKALKSLINIMHKKKASGRIIADAVKIAASLADLSRNKELTAEKILTEFNLSFLSEDEKQPQPGRLKKTNPQSKKKSKVSPKNFSFKAPSPQMKKKITPKAKKEGPPPAKKTLQRKRRYVP